MALRCLAACPPSGSPQRATAHLSVRFVSMLVSAFCPPYDRLERNMHEPLYDPAQLRDAGARRGVGLRCLLGALCQCRHLHMDVDEAVDEALGKLEVR